MVRLSALLCLSPEVVGGAGLSVAGQVLPRRAFLLGRDSSRSASSSTECTSPGASPAYLPSSAPAPGAGLSPGRARSASMPASPPPPPLPLPPHPTPVAAPPAPPVVVPGPAPAPSVCRPQRVAHPRISLLPALRALRSALLAGLAPAALPPPAAGPAAPPPPRPVSPRMRCVTCVCVFLPLSIGRFRSGGGDLVLRCLNECSLFQCHYAVV